MDGADQPTETDVSHEVLDRGVSLGHGRLVIKRHRETARELDQETCERDSAQAIKNVDMRWNVFSRDVISDRLDLKALVEPLVNRVSLGVGSGWRRVRHAARCSWLRKSTDRRCRPVSPVPNRCLLPQPFATPLGRKRRDPQGQPQALTRVSQWVGALVVVVTLLIQQPTALALNDAQQLVIEAWRLVNQSYVDPQQLEAVHWRAQRQQTMERPINSSAQAYDAIDALLANLGDPYTRLLRPEEFVALQQSNEGMVFGVGLQLGLRQTDHQIVVIAPLEGSPAAQAQISSGTEILAINGRSTQALRLETAAALLRGPVGSEVEIRLRRKSGEARDVSLIRRKVDLLPVRRQYLRLGGHDLGYLRIAQFSEPVPDQVEQALVAFSHPTADGKLPVEGLILDLRNNSGGLVSAGLSVANDLLGQAPIVDTEDRSGITSSQSSDTEQLFEGPMVTLVNGGTASASEILAGALQDNGRSLLAGSRTFGKGLIQTLIPLGDGSGLAVTVAHYLTPAGHDIQNLGIKPDLELSPPEPLNPGVRDDPWLRAAEELLLERVASGDSHR
ncbi:MAG: Carboxyl-terminal-processing protease [Cyanobacteriota bacterium]